MNSKKYILTLLLLWMIPLLMTAQDSIFYQFTLKRELGYGLLGAISMGSSEYIRSHIDDIPISKVPSLDLPDIDEVGLNNNPQQADIWSDYTMYTAVGVNSLLLLGDKSRKDFGRISILLTETLLLNAGLTNLSKVVFQRPRPYVYRSDWDKNRLVKSTDRSSLVSGHTSAAAAGSFFFACVFSDYYPNSRLKPYVWGLAISLPAVTGYLRVKANKHYPSDVLAGYGLGAAIGYLVPTLHKCIPRSKRLKIYAGQRLLRLRWVF